MAHPFLQLDRPGTVRAIAHRGGGGAVENTLVAFERAVDRGYRHLETDVHVTADGVLVVSHDPTLARVAGDPRPIATLTRAELASVRVDGREPVPTFDELVTAFPDARLTVDLKVDGAVGPMLHTLERRPELLGRVCIGAFTGARVRTLRRRFGPALMTAATPGEIVRLLAAVRLRRRPPRLTAGVVAVPERYPEGGRSVAVADAALLAAADDVGLPVHVWTVNDPSRMAALVAAGAAGIVTDELDLLRGTLETLGRW